MLSSCELEAATAPMACLLTHSSVIPIFMFSRDIQVPWEIQPDRQS